MERAIVDRGKEILEISTVLDPIHPGATRAWRVYEQCRDIILQGSKECWLLIAIDILEIMYQTQHQEPIYLSKDLLMKWCREGKDKREHTMGKPFTYPIGRTFDRIRDNDGLPCLKDPTKILKIADWDRVKEEQKIIQMLEFHPLIATVIFAPSFKELKKGEIWRGLTPGDLEYFEEQEKKQGKNYKMPLHGLLVVSHGTDEITKENYWLVRNTWGRDWATDGYGMLVLLIGTKLQHVIATLTLESAGISGFFIGMKLKPRDDLFWFKKPELLLGPIHFIHFQNSFELASFFWFWRQFGYNSCFINNHLLVYLRLIIGFFGQFWAATVLYHCMHW
ncbi:hypothetical protein Droror1_Dr00015029 [Drosera rotundifolia]